MPAQNTKIWINSYTLNSFSNLNWTDWKNDAVSRRAASLFRTLRSIYHHLFFEKKTANSTDSNKVDPEKSKKKRIMVY